VINVGGNEPSGNQAGEVIVNVGSNQNTPEEVQITFGNHGSGGTLAVGINQHQNGSGGEEIDLNFNPGNTNQQLVVNLFNGVSNSQPQNNSLSLTA